MQDGDKHKKNTDSGSAQTRYNRRAKVIGRLTLRARMVTFL